MEDDLFKIRVGNLVKVNGNYTEEAYRNRTGTVVVIEPGGQVGIDFKKEVPGMSWDLEGRLPGPTGRYITNDGLKRISLEWDT